MNRAIFGIAAILAVALVIPATATAQSQSKAQQNCINALNKAGAKVAASQGKQNSDCIKNAGKGKEEAAQNCLSADNKLKVMKAKAKTTTAETKKCAKESPDFGRATVGEINTAAMDEEVALIADVFGSDLTAAIIPATTSKEAAACQTAISKAYEKLAKVKVKSFVKCKKAGLKEGAILSAADLEDCVTAVNSDSKVASAAAKVSAAVTKKCDGLDLDATFPGDCVGALDFGVCVDERVECRVCLMLDAMDNLAVDCDLFDNGVADMSCATSPSPSTTSTTSTTTTSTTTTTTLQLSCSVAQPCPGGVECCAGTCLPPDSFCEQRCSESTTVSCLANADCQWPPCIECIGTTGQTCEPQIIQNTCGGGSCLSSESCCGAGSCCRNYDQTCSSGVCQQSCPNGSFACGGSTTIICCLNGQLCLSGVCKTSCGPTSCFPDTETCCGDVCCDTATQVCGQQPGTCVPRQTCTGTDVYIPLLDICCPQQGVCGATACCDVALQQCDIATNQCVSRP